MHVFYINLDKRTDRRDAFLKTNGSIADFERFPAVDGSLLKQDPLIAQGILAEPLQSYTPRALGSAMSHKGLWDRCIDSGVTTTIAEDDAVFNTHFAEKASALLAKLPPDWDIVRWGWNFDSLLDVQLIPGLKSSVMLFNPAPLGERQSEFQQQQYDVVPLRLRNAFGIVCYSVSAKGAERLRQACFPLKKEAVVVPGMRRRINNHCLDVVMNKHYRTLNSFVCVPPLVWAENIKSDTESASLQEAADPPDKSRETG